MHTSISQENADFQNLENANFQIHAKQAGAPEQPCQGRFSIIDDCEEAIIRQHDHKSTKTKIVNCLAVLTYARMRMDYRTNRLTGICQAKIADDLGLGRATVIRTLKALRSMGLLSWTGNTKQVATYLIRPRLSQKSAPSTPAISVCDDTNNEDATLSKNDGIGITADTNKGLFVSPEIPLSVNEIIDDDGDHLSHHRSGGALAEKKPKNAASHRGQRSPAAKEQSYPALPAAWRALRLGRSLDQKAQKCLEGIWKEANLMAAYEKSQSKNDPDAYLSRCLDGRTPTRPTVVAHQYAQRGSYLMADFVDNTPRVSYQALGYELPPLPAPAVAAADLLCIA